MMEHTDFNAPVIHTDQSCHLSGSWQESEVHVVRSLWSWQVKNKQMISYFQGRQAAVYTFHICSTEQDIPKWKENILYIHSAVTPLKQAACWVSLW